MISISSFFNKIIYQKVITPVDLGDSLVAAIFCGIISGLAMCCLLVAGASTGGTDITGKFISKKMDFNLPTVFLIQDITVYIIVWIFFDIKYVMYALVMSFVRNQTMKGVQKFFSAYIQCTIICSNPERMVEVINNTLHRGSTNYGRRRWIFTREKTNDYCSYSAE